MLQRRFWLELQAQNSVQCVSSTHQLRLFPAPLTKLIVLKAGVDGVQSCQKLLTSLNTEASSKSLELLFVTKVSGS